MHIFFFFLTLHRIFCRVISINQNDMEIISMDIGKNAGIVWRALSEEKSGMSFDALDSKVSLSVFDTAAAIGWLARENKIWLTTTEDGKLHLSVYQEYYY